MKRDDLPADRVPLIPRPRLLTDQQRLSRYEIAKKELPNDLTPREYDAAIKALAKRFGI